ncbi:MAG: fimbrillin family protein [Tidjanibacter sp.]|nr:fimbrillin family protein [Tidjanibacter sp.]
MKKIFIFASMLVLAACATEPYEEVVGGDAANGKPLQFTVGVTSDVARTIFTTGEEGLRVDWSSDDKVGISATKEDKALGSNYPYQIIPIANSESVAAQLKPEFSSYQYYCNDVEGATFRAYYPFAGAANRVWDGVVALPSQQAQAAANSSEHLGGYSFMKSKAYTVGEGESQINLEFYNIYSIVAVRLSLLTETIAPMPIQKISLTSDKGTALSFDAATVNLMTTYEEDMASAPVDITAPVDNIDMTLAAPIVLSANGDTIYFMVAPGAHEDGSLKLHLETTNSFAADVTLDGAVTFEPNKVYTKEVALSGEDFYFNGLKPADLTADDEVVITFTMLREGVASSNKTYVLPNTPTASRPTATEIGKSGINLPTGSDIEGAVRDVYKWNFVANGDGTYAICHTADDNTTYYLAQGTGGEDLFVLTEEAATEGGYSTAWTFDAESLGYKMSATGERWVGVTSNAMYFSPWQTAPGYVSIYKVTDHTSLKPNIITSAANVTAGDYIILYNYRKTVDTDYIGIYVFHYEIASQNIVCRLASANGFEVVDGYVSYEELGDYVWTFSEVSGKEDCYTIKNKNNPSSEIYINKTGTAMGVGTNPGGTRTNIFHILDTANYFGEISLQMQPDESVRYFGAYNYEGNLYWRSLSAVGSVYGEMILCKVN